MDWIHVEVGLPGHPKVGRLSRQLKVSRNEALGMVMRLLCWTGQSKEDGHLNGTEAEDLAEICGYDGNPKALLDALVAAGWLDEGPHGLDVHEWMERQGKVFKARERNRKYFAKRQSDALETSAGRHSSGERRGAEQRGEEKKRFRAEPLRDSPPSPPVLVFPCKGNPPTWDLTEALLAELRELFPGLDVLAQARLALAWAKANPDKRKTARGSHAFLTRWLTKATDDPKREPALARAAPAVTPKTYREWEPPA